MDRIEVIDSEILNQTKIGWKICSKVGSPSAPIPRAVTVIPNWQADKYSSKFEITFFAERALLFPSSINWSILEPQTLTIANSEVTKNAVKAIKMAIITKFNMSK